MTMTPMTTDVRELDEERLLAWLREQRWFGAKGRDAAQAQVLDAITLAAGPPELQVALVEARFAEGTHAVYQLPLAIGVDASPQAVLGSVGGVEVSDALLDPGASAQLAQLLGAGAEISGERASVRFHWLGDDDMTPPDALARVAPIGLEQSNSTLVIGEALVLKAYRHVEAGDNPELELVRFLHARGYEHVAPLVGWYELSGEPLDATLGVAQRYIARARDGWTLVLAALDREPEAVLGALGALGGVVGELHRVLGSDASDPAFAPEEPSDETLALVLATVDDQIARVFGSLPDRDDLAPIAGRGEQARDRLRAIAAVGSRGRLIRDHGDLHLGQALLADGRWMLVDFEGEPARPLLERRRKRSPLRDVAGMLRSFAYAASAAERRGRPAPDGWEQRARDGFLEGYLAAVDPALLPPGEAGTRTLLAVFELEKAVYELRYELDNRPDWVPIPVAGIERLLAEPV